LVLSIVFVNIYNKNLKDILNAMQLVYNTKAFLQKLRNEDRDNLLEKIVSFSKQFKIDIPDLGARYVKGQGRH
jgi:hypothetical protein